MNSFLSITNKDEHNNTVIININQIVWIDINTLTIMMSASNEKGLFHTDCDSMGRLIERIKEVGATWTTIR